MSALTHDLPLSPNPGRGMWPFHLGAAADVVVGLALTFFAGDAARLVLPEHPLILGLATASVMRFLGVFLLLFALETVIVARSTGAMAKFRSWIVAANWATVALALVVIAMWHSAFSAVGIAAVAVVAVSVGTFAALQGRAL
ncbi:MAG: hypothetical protein ACREU7_11410 [Burkholderiales bacterium]